MQLSNLLQFYSRSGNNWSFVNDLVLKELMKFIDKNSTFCEVPHLFSKKSFLSLLLEHNRLIAGCCPFFTVNYLSFSSYLLLNNLIIIIGLDQQLQSFDQISYAYFGLNTVKSGLCIICFKLYFIITWLKAKKYNASSEFFLEKSLLIQFWDE